MLTDRTSRADRVQYFDQHIWPHLGPVYNFARWMVKNREDAEDIVQEALAKAYQAADSFRGTDPRTWLLAIVRNQALNFVSRRKPDAEEMHREPADPAPGAELRLAVRTAIARLPGEFREALLLREMEGLSYKEIASVLRIPIGTVMSRLSRARALLMEELR